MMLCIIFRTPNHDYFNNNNSNDNNNNNYYYYYYYTNDDDNNYTNYHYNDNITNDDNSNHKHDTNDNHRINNNSANDRNNTTDDNDTVNNHSGGYHATRGRHKRTDNTQHLAAHNHISFFFHHRSGHLTTLFWYICQFHTTINKNIAYVRDTIDNDSGYQNVAHAHTRDDAGGKVGGA